VKNNIGVCSWSLRAERPDELAARVLEVGANHIQLDLDPIVNRVWKSTVVRERLEGRGISIRSGMMGMRGEDYSTLERIKETGGVRPTEHWSANRESAEKTAEVASEMGLDLVSFHAGFLPHDREDPERALLLERLGTIADLFAARDVRVAFETGQESAATLLEVLADLDRPNLGVNFDPANMVLYAMGDPVEALRLLGEKVLQIHIKDAISAATPGTWGEEVPVGTGEVDWKSFFSVIGEQGLTCDLMIEREAGEQRVEDMRTARLLVEGHLSTGDQVR
jgi:L-ribulose-5-phosphate 3-epimerase